jgi:urocanate hydratase
MRHADAGYELAVETARARGIDLPMLGTKESRAE